MDGDSYSKQQLDDLYRSMISFYSGNPERIYHFTKIHSFARLIGVSENIDTATQVIVEAASYMYDIGIKVAEEKYGKCDGKLQEQESPIVAQKVLSELGFENYLIERICFLLEHHLSFEEIDGMDYQILTEAAFLVNLYDDDCSEAAVRVAYEQIFKTETGKKLLCEVYGLENES